MTPDDVPQQLVHTAQQAWHNAPQRRNGEPTRMRHALAAAWPEIERQVRAKVAAKDAEIARLRDDLKWARSECAKADAENNAAGKRAEQAEDRLRAAEQAYQQLADRHTDTEATRDRWRTRAETAEADARRFRGLAEGLQTELRAAITAQGKAEAERHEALDALAYGAEALQHAEQALAANERVLALATGWRGTPYNRAANDILAALEPPKETT